MESKWFVLLVLSLLAIAYWLIPRTPLAKRLHMNEKLFYGINLAGIICGVLGLVAAFGWPAVILEAHYFELVLMPVVILYGYAAIIMQIRRSEDIYDEKQNYDMTRAAALSLPASFMAMFFLYTVFEEGILFGHVWFPIYVFFTLTVYSGATLYYFVRE